MSESSWWKVSVLQGVASPVLVDATVNTQKFCKPFHIHFNDFQNSFQAEGMWRRDGLMVVSTRYII